MPESIYGFVPARGGSQGLPGKNLKSLGGQPLVVRAIKKLRALPTLASVILSTDSPEIADLGRAAGAWVPFMRPAQLSGPEASVLDAIRHALAYLESQRRPADWVVMVQPTSPFVRPATIAAALEHAIAHDLPVVQTVSLVKEHPYWMRVLAGDHMQPFHPVVGSLRRQDLPPVHILNGAVNIYRTSALRASALVPPAGYFVIDRIEGFDIDEEDDFRLAELLLAHGLDGAK